MKVFWRRELLLVAILICLMGWMSFLSPHFLTLHNLLDLTRHLAEIGIIACGMTLIIMTGGIDLSVGSLLGLCVVVFGYAHQAWHVNATLAVLLTFAVGAAAGAANGALVARWNFPPLVVTLATMALFRGCALGISQAEPVPIAESFWWLGQAYVGPAPVQLIFWTVVAAATAYLCYRTRLGRYAMAIGDNQRAAEIAALPVGRVKLLLYTGSGLLCSLAAIIYAARFATAKADAGQWYELAAITGVVLGGTSITGGRGSVWGTFLGILILGVVRNGLNLAQVSAVWQQLMEGSILIVTATSNELLATFRARLRVN